MSLPKPLRDSAANLKVRLAKKAEEEAKKEIKEVIEELELKKVKVAEKKVIKN